MFYSVIAQNLPKFIPQKQIAKTDSLIVITGKAKVYELYNGKYGSHFHKGFKVCFVYKDSTTLVFSSYASTYNLQLDKNGITPTVKLADVELKYSPVEFTADGEPNPYKVAIVIDFDLTDFTTANSPYVITQREQRCIDTRKNKVKVSTKKSSVQFIGLNNIKVFEFDVNKNKRTEVYVVSYTSCDAMLKIYKVVYD
jgi:hypothetical protein